MTIERHRRALRLCETCSLILKDTPYKSKSGSLRRARFFLTFSELLISIFPRQGTRLNSYYFAEPVAYFVNVPEGILSLSDKRRSGEAPARARRTFLSKLTQHWAIRVVYKTAEE